MRRVHAALAPGPRRSWTIGVRAASTLIILTFGVAAGAAAQAGITPGTYAGPRGISMSLTADGQYRFGDRDRTFIAGAFQMDAGEMVLRDTGGPRACPEEARYLVRQAGDTLRFEAVRDPCDGRRGALTAAPWIRARAALVLTGATVIDGTGAPPRPGMTLVLREGRIAALHPDGAQPLPEDAVARALNGAFVIPGLIDTHVHLATNPSETDWRARAERRLRNALLGGVAVVRDMGGDARALADLSRAAGVGDIVSPEVRYAAIVAGPAFFDDARVRASSAGVTIGTAPWARAVTGATDLRQIVAEARGTGAAGIKLYGALDSAVAARVTAEAHRQGLSVWAHLALFPARPGEVVGAGPDVVSHALLLAYETADHPGTTPTAPVDLTVGADHPGVARAIARMRERRTILEPTLLVFRADSTLPDTAMPRRRATRAAEFTRAAHQAGVPIAAGTDGMGSDSVGVLPNLHEELALLVQAGLTPMEALVAATSTAARAAGVAATHGTIAVGKAADLVVLRLDPTADIRATREILFVTRRGSVVER